MFSQPLPQSISRLVTYRNNPGMFSSPPDTQLRQQAVEEIFEIVSRAGVRCLIDLKPQDGLLEGHRAAAIHYPNKKDMKDGLPKRLLEQLRIAYPLVRILPEESPVPLQRYAARATSIGYGPTISWSPGLFATRPSGSQATHSMWIRSILAPLPMFLDPRGATWTRSDRLSLDHEFDHASVWGDLLQQKEHSFYGRIGVTSGGLYEAAKRLPIKLLFNGARGRIPEISIDEALVQRQDLNRLLNFEQILGAQDPDGFNTDCTWACIEAHDHASITAHVAKGMLDKLSDRKFVQKVVWSQYYFGTVTWNATITDDNWQILMPVVDTAALSANRNDALKAQLDRTAKMNERLVFDARQQLRSRQG